MRNIKRRTPKEVIENGNSFIKKKGNFEKDLGLEKIVASLLGISILLFSLFNVVNINGFVINNSVILSSINLIWILMIVSFLISFFILKNLEDIKAIVIPTGSLEEDIRRSKTAIDFVNKNNLPKRCIIAGLGPDTNIALGYDKNKNDHKLDFHKDMYDYLMKNTDWTIGVDVRSLNSIENILETFPKGTEGKYAIVSYPLHIKRIKTIVKDAKRAGKISKNLEFVYIPTKQDLRWVPYEVLSNLKYHSGGKNKYFNKKQQ
jgi:hypothetical protein